jgi:hypothetical protein
MANAQSEKTYSYQLRVRSLDPSQPVSDVVARINELGPQMEGELKEYGSKVKFSVQREKTIPVDPVTIIILIELANITLKPMLEGFFKKLGEKMADFLTGEVDNAQISVEKEPTSPGNKKEEKKEDKKEDKKEALKEQKKKEKKNKK